MKINKSFRIQEAQRLGFAEADPTADVSGLDAAYKIVILSAVALKADIQIDDVFFEGIEHVQLKDTLYLDELGIGSLIAKAKRVGDALTVAVYPTAIPSDHPLATVRNEFNAIFSTGNMVGESMIYGKGGSLPTGSAVMSDILDIAFDIHAHRSRRNLEAKIGPIGTRVASEHAVLLSTYCTIKPVYEEMSHLFKKQGINIAQLIQKERLGMRLK